MWRTSPDVSPFLATCLTGMPVDPSCRQSARLRRATRIPQIRKKPVGLLGNLPRSRRRLQPPCFHHFARPWPLIVVRPAACAAAALRSSCPPIPFAEQTQEHGSRRPSNHPFPVRMCSFRRRKVSPLEPLPAYCYSLWFPTTIGIGVIRFLFKARSRSLTCRHCTRMHSGSKASPGVRVRVA